MIAAALSPTIISNAVHESAPTNDKCGYAAFPLPCFSRDDEDTGRFASAVDVNKELGTSLVDSASEMLGEREGLTEKEGDRVTVGNEDGEMDEVGKLLVVGVTDGPTLGLKLVVGSSDGSVVGLFERVGSLVLLGA
jgi:hypothetical protein